MRKLLDLLNTARQSEVPLRTDILQTILGVFQLDSARKALFRDGDGFNYLLSVLSSLYGSLAPYRTSPWDSGEHYHSNNHMTIGVVFLSSISW